MNWIQVYHRQIMEGHAVVGAPVRNIYKRLADGIANGAYRFSGAKAGRAIEFIETFCRHSEGSNERVRLEVWQKALVSAIFGVLDEKGYRLFREVLLIIGRKNGKTLLASALMAYMAYADGEYGAMIYCAATKIEQAGKAFDGCYQMIQTDEDLAALARKRRSDVYIEATNSVIKPLTYNGRTLDGLNPHMAVCDEIAAWSGNKGFKLYNVLKSAFGARRQPLLLSISTAGDVNDGIYDEMLMRATAFLDGKSGETRFLPVIYALEDSAKWDDMRELRKANPNMGVSFEPEFLEEGIKTAKESPAYMKEFKAKFCNLKQNSCVSWLDYDVVAQAFERGRDVKLDEFAKHCAVVGFDLSRAVDLTAATFAIERGGAVNLFTRFFAPSARLDEMEARDKLPYKEYARRGFLIVSDGEQVDYHDVFNWIYGTARRLKLAILKIGYDPAMAPYLINELENAGFDETDTVRQGYNLTPVMAEFEGLIRNSQINICEGNSLLMAHFLNVAIKTKNGGAAMMPWKAAAADHIDGFMSVIDAMTVRQKYAGELGIMLSNKHVKPGKTA